MAPALDVMLLRIRARALEGDQNVIRSFIEHFGSIRWTGRAPDQKSRRTPAVKK